MKNIGRVANLEATHATVNSGRADLQPEQNKINGQSFFKIQFLFNQTTCLPSSTSIKHSGFYKKWTHDSGFDPVLSLGK